MSARPSVPADLVGAIYEAAGNPGAWAPAVERATAWVGGAAGSFQARNVRGEPRSWLISTGVDPALHAAYLAHYYKADPHLAHIDRLRVHSTLLSSEIIEDAVLMRTEYYDGFYRPQRFRDLQGVVLIRNENWVVSLAMFAGASHRFDRETKAKLDALAPHFTRALKLAFPFDAPSLPEGGHPGASGEAAAIIHVDGELQLVERERTNLHAWLHDATSPVFIAEGRLTTREAADAERLARAVKLALLGHGDVVTFGAPDLPFAVGFAPAAPRNPFGLERCAMVLFFAQRPVRQDGCAAFADLPTKLQEVAQCLARGASDKDIARELGYSVATARTYSSRVLARLGLRDRRELMKRR